MINQVETLEDTVTVVRKNVRITISLCIYFVAFSEYPNFMKKYGMCNEFGHSAGLVDFFYHFTQYSTYRLNWGGGPEMAIFPYITVVCIKVRTASFPRFWKTHP